MCCIVLDLEWNQPFSMRSMITTPVRLHGEIIQIGAVKLNEQLEIVDTFKVMVKPKYYPYMHRKISRLTQISNADLAYGFPFKQAGNSMRPHRISNAQIARYQFRCPARS